MLAPSKPVFKCLIEGFLLSIKRKYIKGILLSIKAYNNAHNAFNPNVFIFIKKKMACTKENSFHHVLSLLVYLILNTTKNQKRYYLITLQNVSIRKTAMIAPSHILICISESSLNSVMQSCHRAAGCSN